MDDLEFLEYMERTSSNDPEDTQRLWNLCGFRVPDAAMRTSYLRYGAADYIRHARIIIAREVVKRLRDDPPDSPE